MKRHPMSFSALALLLAVFLAHPNAEAARKQVIRSLKVGNTSYYVMKDVANFYGFRTQVKGKDYVFSSKYSTLNLTLDSKNASLNDIKFALAFPMALSKYKSLLISQADFQFYLDPLLRSHRLPRKIVSRIVIDPGHGGKDPGCKGGNTTEKKVNLDVGLKLAKVLVKRGYTVAMTRMVDKELSLKQRTDLATSFKPDLFISLHCNYASAKVSGIEVFCSTPQFTPSFGSTKPFTRKCPGDAHGPHSAYIAYHTQKRLIEAMKIPDRGVKHKRFNVIANINAPAILIEMGFLSDAGDKKMLTASQKQTKIAVAIADAIDDFKRATAPPKLN